MGRVSFWGDENVLEADSGYGCKTLCMYKLPLDFTLENVKMGYFMLCEFYHKKKNQGLKCSALERMIRGGLERWWRHGCGREMEGE